MSYEYNEKLSLQHQQQFIYDGAFEFISYLNDDEPAINYHQHFHQSQAQQQQQQQQTAASYPFALPNSAATNASHSNYIKEDQIYYIPTNQQSSVKQQQQECAGKNNYQNSGYQYSQQQPISSSSTTTQQQLGAPFSLGLNGTSKSIQSTQQSNSNSTSQQNYIFPQTQNSYIPNSHNNNNINQSNSGNGKQFLPAFPYSQKSGNFTGSVKNTTEFNQNQYNFDLSNQECIFLPNHHQYASQQNQQQQQQCSQTQQLLIGASNACSSQQAMNNNQGSFYKNVQDAFPSIQTLNDVDTVFSSTHDIQSTTTCAYTSSNINNKQQQQMNQQPLLQLNQIVQTHSAPTNYFQADNNYTSNNYKLAEALIFDDYNIHSEVERVNNLEAKNEESISSQNSLSDKYSKSSKNTSPIMNACSGAIRKSSESDSDATKSSTTLGLNKQQSQLKNANKFCMVSLLNYLTDILPNSKEFHHLIKYIIRVKGSGKMRQKVDIFTLAHFRVLFLTLNDWNLTQLNANDIKMHKMIFSEVNKNSPWTKEDLDFMNAIKAQLLYLSIQFFEDSSNIKQKIQSKPWQNEDTAKHYIEWVNRISKGIKKMSSGVYIHRF